METVSHYELHFQTPIDFFILTSEMRRLFSFSYDVVLNTIKANILVSAKVRKRN